MIEIYGYVAQIISPEEQDIYIFDKHDGLYRKLFKGKYMVVICREDCPKNQIAYWIWSIKRWLAGDNSRVSWDFLFEPPCPYKLNDNVSIIGKEIFIASGWYQVDKQKKSTMI